MSSSYDVLNWETNDVCNWLESKNFKNYVNVFRSNQINGYDLFQITSEELKTDFKILNFHDRANFNKELRKLLIDNCNI